MIKFLLVVSRQGKVRLAKWYQRVRPKERIRIRREVTAMVLSRPGKLCNFLEWRDDKIVYRRYASLYFVACIGKEDNELIALETVHAFVEVLDQYFDNVCELDIIFNFHKAYHILDEMILAGEVVETNKRTVRNAVRAQDELAAVAREGGGAGAAAASGLVPIAGGSR